MAANAWRGALRDHTKNGCVADYRVARNFGGSLIIFADWRFLGVLRELIFAIWTDFFFSCWELIFAIFRKYPVPSIDNIFVFIEYVQ